MTLYGIKKRIGYMGLYLICLLCMALVVVFLPFYILRGSPRALRMLCGVDRLGNALFNGNDRETLSSRAHRVSTEDGRRWACVLCRVLHVFDKDHCKKSAGT